MTWCVYVYVDQGIIAACLGEGAGDEGTGAVPKCKEVIAVSGSVKLLAFGDVEDVANDAVGMVLIGLVARGLFV